MSSAITLAVGEDGIAIATMDLPGRPMNVVGDELMLGIAQAVERLADPAAKGLVLTSGKADFCAGGDIDRMSKWTRPEEPFEAGNAMKAGLRKMEGQGKPVAESSQFTWLQEGKFYTLTAATASTDSLIFARIGANDPDFNLRRDAALIIRRPEAQSTVFASVIEPHELHRSTNATRGSSRT